MPPIVWIDGAYYDRASAKISVFDHGLLYGDGVFEGIRVYNRRVFRLAQHLDRLYGSAKGAWLEIPVPKPAMRRVVEEAVVKSGLEDAYIRLIVTRGVGDLGLDPRKCAKPTTICIVDTIQLWSPDRYEKGLTALTAATPISHRESLSPRIKSLNYLSHILAKVEGIAASVDEVIMLDAQGYVAEASGMNLFAVANGTLKTPPPYAGILRGVTRDAVIELAREATYGVEELPLNRYDLYTADEMFLTGTAAEIVPVVKLDGRMIGSGAPGPVTKELSQRFRTLATRGD
ncbi:MAG TPA: branched-chain-amino-acid transaminase [Gemmatimonadales bacterium]|jgi:branched-chain amino acid aminotransferase|nr:branched-chain-amino-acid transaminase [Gemmatimonadales bacterium]